MANPTRRVSGRMRHSAPNRYQAGCGMAVFCCLALTMLSTGCRLFNSGWFGSLTDRSNSKQKKSDRAALPAIPRLPQTVGLEVVFVERPVGDPLLKEKNLWLGVDTVGELDPETRDRLQKDGFRIGHVNSAANPAIESMLGVVAQTSGVASPVDPRSLTGRRLFRPAGGKTDVQVSRYRKLLRIDLSGPAKPVEFENARCMFNVKADKLQDGWARLEFTPEIHHGRLGWRPMATDAGWKGTTSQKVHRLYTHRFSMTLNQGEMAVITADNRRAESLGGQFFRDGEPGSQVQRVLLVRLIDASSMAIAGKPARSSKR